MAMRASAACRLPTCLCSRPERARMKTSNSGQSSLMGRDLVSRRCDIRGRTRSRAPPAMLGGVGERRFPNPAACLVRGATRLQPLLIAGAIALEHRLELAPVDRAGEVVL